MQKQLNTSACHSMFYMRLNPSVKSISKVAINGTNKRARMFTKLRRQQSFCRKTNELSYQG